MWMYAISGMVTNPLELEFKAVMSLQCGFGGLNAGLLEGQQMILTAVLSLRPSSIFL